MRSGLRGAVDRVRELFKPRPNPALPERHATLPDTRLRDVRIDYDPSLDGDPDPGEVVWTWVAYEDDPTQGKDRPVVIIGRDGAHLAGVALSSHGGERDDHVEVGTGSWDRDRRVSYARLDRILAVDPEAMRREGAVLERDRFDVLVAALQEFHRRH